MKSLKQFIYEKAAHELVYILFWRPKFGPIKYYIEDSDGGVAARFSPLSDEYTVYGIKCTNQKQAIDKIKDIIEKTKDSWEKKYLSDLIEDNKEFDEALDKEFGDKKFWDKEFVETTTRDGLQDCAVNVYKSLIHEYV